jgi:hypothetical protein
MWWQRRLEYTLRSLEKRTLQEEGYDPDVAEIKIHWQVTKMCGPKLVVFTGFDTMPGCAMSSSFSFI